MVIGEEVIGTLKDFADTHLEGKFATFSGIGAVKDITIGYYKNYAYFNKEYNDEYEVLNFNGNISIKEENRFSHIHIVFAGEDYIAHGGHLHKATVSATLEIVVNVHNKQISRHFDEESKLYLLG